MKKNQGKRYVEFVHEANFYANLHTVFLSKTNKFAPHEGSEGTVVTMDVVGPTGVEWHDGLGRRGRHHLDRGAHELPSHRGPRSGLTRRDQINLDRPGRTFREGS